MEAALELHQTMKRHVHKGVFSSRLFPTPLTAVTFSKPAVGLLPLCRLIKHEL